jgi:hypothetical protein
MELYSYITALPSAIQVLFIVLCLIGAYVVYKFRVIVALISAGAIALFIALKKNKE